MIDLAHNWIEIGAIAQLARDLSAHAGQEVFFVGETNEDGMVVHVEAHAWGDAQSVLAFSNRVRPGQIMIHNHPSGTLHPSEADWQIASIVGQKGGGFYIIDADVHQVARVVRPWTGSVFQPLDVDAIQSFFGAKSIFSNVLPQFQPREPQRALNQTIIEVLNLGQIGLLEAGTGVGKSFAYLLPAAKLAQQNKTPVIVSTATLALQDQLLKKDIPTLSSVLEQPIKAVVLKGRGQYVSIRRAHSWIESTGEADHWIAEWLDQTSTGQRNELTPQIDPEIWEEIQSESDNCRYAKCPHYNQCHFFNSRRQAATAQLVVVNHALLSADIKVRGLSEIDFEETVLLPGAQHFVLDEAHEFERYARNQLGVQTSAQGWVRVLNQLIFQAKKPGALARLRDRWIDRSALIHKSIFDHHLEQMHQCAQQAAKLAEQARHWFGLFAARMHDAQLDSLTMGAQVQNQFPELLEDGIQLAAQTVKLCSTFQQWLEPLDEDELPPGIWDLVLECQSRVQRLQQHADVLRAVITNAELTEVAWAELNHNKNAVRFSIVPVDLGPTLKKWFWQPIRSAILTSATLSTPSQGMQFVKQAIGLDDQTTIIENQFGSPFDFANRTQAILVQGLQGAATNRWQPDEYTTFLTLVEASAGGALVLCTSYQQARSVTQFLREQSQPFEVYLQGEQPLHTTIKKFSASPDSVLVGTAALWAGIDVPGASLRHVIVTKLPFEPPNHPVTQARHRYLEKQGKNPFKQLTLPEATIRFKQGIGRLIRRSQDYGIITVLDPRVTQKGYGKDFLRTLPADTPVFTESAGNAALRIKAAIQNWQADVPSNDL